MASAGCNELTIGVSPVIYYETEDRTPVVPIVDSGFFWLKSAFDRLLALLLLIPMLPVIGIIVLLVRVTSKGPGIYQQKRVGKGGRIFTMYKIRSMRMDAECKTGPTWAGVVRDPRVTPLGFWLRRLHLDELPQLFNVLWGEMSLVGPRPERPEFVSILADQIPGYLDRLAIAPGITGLAQINLPPDTDLDSVRRKLALDCEYICIASWLLDLRILVSTALRMFGIRHGRAVWLMGLERDVKLSKGSLPVGGISGGPTAIETVANSRNTVVDSDTATATRGANDTIVQQDPATGESQALSRTVEFSDTIEFEIVNNLQTELESKKTSSPRRRSTAR